MKKVYNYKAACRFFTTRRILLVVLTDIQILSLGPPKD
jgi:hypothetical protein